MSTQETDPYIEISLNSDCPDLNSLPWVIPLTEWSEKCKLTEDLPHGKSRHEVVFLNCHGTQYVVKEMASGAAQNEYQNLIDIQNSHIPIVEAIGFVQLKNPENNASFLITRYLERSLPYRIIFGTPTLETYKIHLLDAIASLLVQNHLAGIFWGDCSLSNTLFRRDAGALQAYMVDAENSEIHLPPLMPALRFQDLQTMETNIIAEMIELSQEGFDFSSAMVYETGKSIRQRYHLLWEEITQEAVISPHETYQIQERIRKLNNLGYAIKDIDFLPTGQGDKLRLRIQVADRNFHRNQLQELTGLISEERQAQTLINEIHEVRALLTRQRNSQMSIEAAAYQWLETIYMPTKQRLEDLIGKFEEIKTKHDGLFNTDPTELYCQVLEHKWYLSERAQQDVGHQSAVEDFVKFSSQGLLYE